TTEDNIRKRDRYSSVIFLSISEVSTPNDLSRYSFHSSEQFLQISPSYDLPMGSCQEFQVTVHTSPGPTCGTYNRLYLSLIGSHGETPPIPVNNDHHLLPGSVMLSRWILMNLLFLSSQTCLVLVRANGPLGQVVLVRLRLEAQIGFPNVDWHCNRVEIRQCTKDQEPEPESSETQINGKQTYLSAPLCLLHLNQQGQMVPIAIQLQQTPGPQNPVFLPSDSDCDWLLAKIWVHSADFQGHQLISHYMRTHMMAELCCVATLRQFPEHHPLHQVNTSRHTWNAVGSGLKTIPEILRRASATIHYRSMCVPDDLSDRAVDKLPHSFYAQDALRIWDALHRGDKDIKNDSELQNWITDINKHGFTQNSGGFFNTCWSSLSCFKQIKDLTSSSSGFPQCFHTKAEVSKFLTMFIYSCSALHAAVNFSQLDFALWMPNCPPSMMRPPPQVKGGVTEQDILSFLPGINSTLRVLMALTVLSQPSVDFIPLCHYREAIFRVDAHRRLVEGVQAELKAINDDITERNRHLELPYPYLCPSGIENSVAI
ncbi:hypothetical protein XENOCAPTIV_030881, partial [Xenoophorus captivus]